jgi:hypothetical protein
LSQINAALSDAPDDSEKRTMKAMKKKQKQILENDLW